MERCLPPFRQQRPQAVDGSTSRLSALWILRGRKSSDVLAVLDEKPVNDRRQTRRKESQIEQPLGHHQPSGHPLVDIRGIHGLGLPAAENHPPTKI